MPINPYETRTMLEALRVSKRPKTFLRDLFFSRHVAVDTEKVDIDITKAKRKMAPFVHQLKSGSVMERHGRYMDSYVPAMMKPKTVASSLDWQARQPGEVIYSDMTPEERAAKLFAEDILYLDEVITRREEWMCACALTTGQIVQKGEGIDEVVELPLTTVTLGASDKWSAATGKPLTYLRNARREMAKASGIVPNTAILGKNALDAFLSNTEVQTFSDKNKVLLTEIEPQIPRGELDTQGVIYWGYLRDSAMYLYTYDEWYEDPDTGVEGAMMPDDLVILGNPAARTSLLYGAWTEAIEENNSVVTHVGERIPRSWVEKDPSVRYVQMVSRPLPVPHEIDAFRSVKVV